MIRKILIFIVIILFSYQLKAQTFTMIDSLPVGAYGTGAWGDFDNDGRKDLVYITQTMTAGEPDIFKIYHNTADGFIAVPQEFIPFFNPAARWADLNNDGFEDLVISGLTIPDAVLYIYKSNGDGTFDLVSDTLPGLSAGSIDIADYNGDGLKDIAANGYTNTSGIMTFLFKNEDDFNFSISSTSLPGLAGGEIKWCDYDHDGKMDIGFTGQNISGETYIYHNEGADSFSLASPYMKGGLGTLDWLDYNGDGWEDLLVAGNDSGIINFTHLYSNNADGTFTLQTTNLPPFGEPVATEVADFDTDGKPDICLAGGNEIFSETYSAMALCHGDAPFELSAFYKCDITNCIVAAADIDNDGDPDLLFSNFILRNDGFPVNIVTPEKTQAAIYPNPAQDHFIIETDVKISMDVVNVAGRIVLQKELEAGTNNIDTRNLKPGTYFINLNNDKTKDSHVLKIL